VVWIGCARDATEVNEKKLMSKMGLLMNFAFPNDEEEEG
jgi:hypothetical protein